MEPASVFGEESLRMDKKATGSVKSYNELVMAREGYFSSLLYKSTEVITNILSTSKGRNKVCSLIQYSANLVYECQINSNIPEVAEMVM
jgi:hypothetical protein